MNKEDKLKALDAAISQIEKQHGKGAIMKLGDSGNKMNVESVSYTHLNDILALRTTLKDKKATIKDFTLALYNFILSTNMEKRINDYVDMFEKDNKPELSKEYQQIYGVIILMLERIVNLMGEETVSPKEYVEILKAGFLEAKVGIIPPGLDTLMVGDIERTRLKDTRCV